MASVFKNEVGQWPPEVAEAVALLFGLQLTVDMSFRDVIAETDSLMVINALHGYCLPYSTLGIILQECLELSYNALVNFSIKILNF